MAIEQLTIPTIKELFIETIEFKILSGVFEIGDKLPSERELASKMQISKTIVHDGLKELERIGFITAYSGRGTYVADYTKSGSIEVLQAFTHYNNNNLDSATHTSMVELRLACEPGVLIDFTKKGTSDDTEELVKLKNNILYTIDQNFEIDDISEALFIYHKFIYSISGNNVFPIILNIFHDLAILSISNFIRNYSIDFTRKWIIEITSLLTLKKGKEAARLMKHVVYEYGRTCKIPVSDVYQ